MQSSNNLSDFLSKKLTKLKKKMADEKNQNKILIEKK